MSKKKRAKQAKRAAAWGMPQGMVQTPAGGLFASLQGLRRSEQFLVGALLGAAAVYVMGDEQLRGKLIKAGVSLYTNLAGGFEEIKEQVADLRAEMQAGGQTEGLGA